MINSVSDGDVCNVFHMSKTNLDRYGIECKYFQNEDIGNCREFLEIYVIDGEDNLTDLKDVLGYGGDVLLSSFDFKGVIDTLSQFGYKDTRGFLIKTRIESDILIEDRYEKSDVYKIMICSDRLSDFLDVYPNVEGWLAKNRACIEIGKEESTLCKLLDEGFERGDLSEYLYHSYKSYVGGYNWQGE